MATANPYGADLGDRIPLIVDGGATAHGLESTIVAATGGPLRLLRPGPIDLALAVDAGGGIEAPGQLASHYAPSKPLRLDARSAEPTTGEDAAEQAFVASVQRGDAALWVALRDGPPAAFAEQHPEALLGPAPAGEEHP